MPSPSAMETSVMRPSAVISMTDPPSPHYKKSNNEAERILPRQRTGSIRVQSSERHPPPRLHLHDVERRHAEPRHRFLRERTGRLNLVNDFGPHGLSALRTYPFLLRYEDQRPEDGLLRAARARQRHDEVAIEQQGRSLERLEKRGRRARGPERDSDRRRIRLVRQAVLAPLESRRVEVVRLAVEDERRPRLDGQAVEKLQGLLRFEARDHRRDRRRRGDLSLGDVLAPEQRARIAEIEQAVIRLGHRALVARARGRAEDLDDAADLLDRAVDPRLPHFPALAVDPQARLAVVE